MKKILLRTGIYALIVTTLQYMITVLAGKWMGFAVQEIFGYAGIILSLLFVYFGMRQYRDREKGGMMGFGQGLKIGLLITLIPSVMIGLLDFIYTSFINKSFYKEYYATYQARIKVSLTLDKYEAALRQLESEKAMFANPLFQFAIMFLTVFLIGVIITVISPLILRRRPKQSLSNPKQSLNL